ncbi:MAG: hypothetical protein H0X39_15680 [Actinobacteria bacterium]|nr:hypothetical protein [Actinomycetota bacterium]
MARHTMWPTPKARDAKGGNGPNYQREGGMSLPDAVKRWPTPTATDAHGGRNATARRPTIPQGRTNHNGITLNDAVLMEQNGWDTPKPSEKGPGPLNPRWVEWLMGFPVGWLNSEPSATPSSPRSPSSSAVS